MSARQTASRTCAIPINPANALLGVHASRWSMPGARWERTHGGVATSSCMHEEVAPSNHTQQSGCSPPFVLSHSRSGHKFRCSVPYRTPLPIQSVNWSFATLVAHRVSPFKGRGRNQPAADAAYGFAILDSGFHTSQDPLFSQLGFNVFPLFRGP